MLRVVLECLVLVLCHFTVQFIYFSNFVISLPCIIVKEEYLLFYIKLWDVEGPFDLNSSLNGKLSVQMILQTQL